MAHKRGCSVSPSRPHDYLYDPLFTVPTFKDFMKAANCAAREAAEIQLRPVFKNMFSELPHYPSVEVVVSNKSCFPQQVHKTLCSRVARRQFDRASEVNGIHRHKYFTSALEPTQECEYAPLVRRSSKPWTPSPLSTTYVVTRELKSLERPVTEPRMALMTASYRNNGTQTMQQQFLQQDHVRVDFSGNPREAVAARMQQLREAGEERLRLAAKLRAEHAAAAQAQREASRARTKARWDERKEAELTKLMARHNREVRKLARDFNEVSVQSENAAPRVEKSEHLELPIIQSLPVVTPSL
ncbi:Hypothetical predicted protein [Cloeon dipterum]|uniref:Uncharacterized protein n=1 Tax=Cloeon dipterum TaxID=197152 RepID=A0A8S1CYR6_9INSE|nr:Hypothetical predicted protein [Cloeon dipterum]